MIGKTIKKPLDKEKIALYKSIAECGTSAD